MNKLQKALTVNALFSGISGLFIIILSQQIATIFGVKQNSPFWITGIVLLYFAATIWYEIRKERKTYVLWIIVQDFLWVIGSIILILLNPFKITSTGIIITAVVALAVLYMAINQSLALKK